MENRNMGKEKKVRETDKQPLSSNLIKEIKQVCFLKKRKEKKKKKGFFKKTSY